MPDKEISSNALTKAQRRAYDKGLKDGKAGRAFRPPLEYSEFYARGYNGEKPPTFTYVTGRPLKYAGRERKSLGVRVDLHTYDRYMKYLASTRMSSSQLIYNLIMDALEKFEQGQ